jgi:IclR family acetate operon transcriptional repressor
MARLSGESSKQACDQAAPVRQVFELEASRGRGLSSFPRIVDVLYAMTSSSQLQSVRAIAQATGNSRSATQRILKSLADAGYAEQRECGSYAVGPRLVELSARVFAAVSTLKLANSIMSRLVREIGETCHLATYSRGDRFTVYHHRVESGRVVRHIQPFGVPLPLHAGAVGKAILSVSDSKLDDLPLTRYTPQTPTTNTALRKDLEKARAAGYATSFGERVAGMIGVAAPLMAGDSVVGSLAVAIPTWRPPRDGIDHVGRTVRKYAEELSLQLTGMGAKRI